LLGLSSQADTKAIRASYFALAKRYHPDVFFRRDIGAARRKLEAVFDALTLAYETLRRPHSRSEYDDSLGLLAHERYVAPKRKSSHPPAILESESDRVERESREHPFAPGGHFAEPARHGQFAQLPPRPDEPARTVTGEATGTSARAPRPANQKSLRDQAEARAARLNQAAGKPITARHAVPNGPQTHTGTHHAPPQPARASIPNPPQGNTGTHHAPPQPARASIPNPPQGNTGTHHAPQPARASIPNPPQGNTGTHQGAPLSGRPSMPLVNTGTHQLTGPLNVGQVLSPSTGTQSLPQGSEWERSTQLRELEELKQLRKQPATVPPASGVVRRDSLPAQGARSSAPPADLPSLVTIGLEFASGTGLHHWVAQRVREAHQEEQAGHAVDAANILRIVLAQHKDARIEAHVERLGRMSSHKTVPALRARARAAEKEERWSDAIKEWESIVKLVPDDAPATFCLARALMVAGDLKAAGRAAMRAAELAPMHVETRELLVEFFERMGMKLNARREREIVAKLLESRAQAAAKDSKRK
jgi:hypothetical protein